jgi:hypothetical protein
MLLSEDDVAAAIRSQLHSLALRRSGRRHKVALYTEREFAESTIFKSAPTADRHGKIRIRAYGNRGPQAVQPTRGRSRVGSEGWTAFLISQAVEASRTIYLNHPGPDRIRRHKVGLIAIVTDFIGSGGRVNTMLDKFLRVPSVRSWLSNRWINFAVVAAAATSDGMAQVSRHRSKPTLYVCHVVPSLATFADQATARAWKRLTLIYGPRSGRGAGPQGYQDGGALVAFSYRTPNNTPLLLHERDNGWSPLFQGPPSDDMRPAFGLPPLGVRVSLAATATGQGLAADLSAEEGRVILVLRAIRGRWLPKQEVGFAERTGLTVPEVLGAKARAQALGLLTAEGRLTDDGQKLVRAGSKTERRRPDIPTRTEPYYPLVLRAPR